MGKELAEALERIKALEDKVDALERPSRNDAFGPKTGHEEDVDLDKVAEEAWQLQVNQMTYGRQRDAGNAKQLIGCEIDPDALETVVSEAMIRPDKFKAEHPGMEASSVYVRTDYFVAFLEIAKLIGRVLQWNRKGRLVLDYDPKKAKFTLAAIREGDVSTSWPEETP